MRFTKQTGRKHLTQKDESPEAGEGPYWSEELLAVLVEGLGDETQARETLEGIIQPQKRPWRHTSPSSTNASRDAFKTLMLHVGVA